jgi:hypothetical protein
VDFDRLDTGMTRFSAGAVNVRTGNLGYFDDHEAHAGARAHHGERRMHRTLSTGRFRAILYPCVKRVSAVPTRSLSIVPKPPTAIAAEQRHPADDLKTPDEVDYFAMLSRAVARLDRDSYEARGAIYDRAREVLAKRLASATPPYSKDEVAKQQLALREAIRRIEFEDREDLDTIAVQHISGEETNGSNLDGGRIHSKRKRLFGRVAARLLIATLILGIGIGAYAYSTGSLDLTFLTRLLERVIGSAPVQRALLYERSATNPNAAGLDGTAIWQILPEGAGINPEAVLQVEVHIPERGLSLVMSMRREPSEAAAMSHLVEFRFLRSDQSPFAEIARVGGIAMTTAEHSRSEVVLGQPTKVMPGVFLFGLAADKGQREGNLRILRELTWMDIPISYQNGSQALLAIEKGAAGERVLNQFFSDPGQR